MRHAILAVFVVAALAMSLASCGADSKTTATGGSSGASSASSSSSATGQQVQASVEAYAKQIGSELGQAPASVNASSNPYDYLDYCPTYRNVVALGPPALPAIAHYILRNRASGLDGYILAIAGEEIWGSHGTPLAAGAKSWESSDQWARQYLAWAEDHPSGN